MTAKVFFKKLKDFTKRNLPAMAVSFCMLFAVSLVTAVAVTYTKSNKEEVVSVNAPQETQPEPDKPVAAPAPMVFVLPVAGATEGLPFAQDNLVKFETLSKWQTHEAVDFVAIAGTKVVSAYGGRVESIENDSNEGTIVVIDHGNNLKTIYKSLSPELVVKVGDNVKAGDQIGIVSNSATNEANLGAHLHFEVMKNGEYVDPYEYLPAGDK